MSAQRTVNAPEHPGSYVKSQVIDGLGLSVTDAAQALGVTRPALSKFLNERADLSSEMALRIEKAFGVSMDALMQMQNAFDIAEARKKEHDINVLPFRVCVSAPTRNSANRSATK